MSMGMGYGKRLTFKGDTLNNNECFFWSDSMPDGYAFSIVALLPKERFIVYNGAGRSVADVVIETVETPGVELSSTIDTGSINKHVQTRFACSMNYHHRHHGLLVDVISQEVLDLSGIVEVVKGKREREAQVVCIKNVFVPLFGECTLWKD